MTKLNPILSKPECGWSSFNIGDFSFPVSYLKDAPQDFIDAFTISLSDGWTHSVVELDSEGENCLVIICPYSGIYTIVNRSDNEAGDNKIEIRYFCINTKRLAKQLIIDIEKYKEDWASWQFYNDEKKYYDLSKLKELINE